MLRKERKKRRISRERKRRRQNVKNEIGYHHFTRHTLLIIIISSRPRLSCLEAKTKRKTICAKPFLHTYTHRRKLPLISRTCYGRDIFPEQTHLSAQNSVSFIMSKFSWRREGRFVSFEQKEKEEQRKSNPHSERTSTPLSQRAKSFFFLLLSVSVAVTSRDTIFRTQHLSNNRKRRLHWLFTPDFPYITKQFM